MKLANCHGKFDLNMRKSLYYNSLSKKKKKKTHHSPLQLMTIATYPCKTSGFSTYQHTKSLAKCTCLSCYLPSARPGFVAR